MLCSLDGCENEVVPPQRKFCSRKHSLLNSDIRRQGTPRRLASRRAHNHSRGWYVTYKRRLKRRIRQRTEEV